MIAGYINETFILISDFLGISGVLLPIIMVMILQFFVKSDFLIHFCPSLVNKL